MAGRHKTSKTTLVNITHEVTEQVKDSEWIAKRFNPQWSGTLVVDGKVIKVYNRFAKNFTNLTSSEYRAAQRMTWLCGIDYTTGDLPHYSLADSENRIDLILFFKQLKKNGYSLRILVSDGNPEIPRAAEKVYGKNNILHQLCTRHFLQGLKRQLNETEEEKNIPATKNLIAWIGKIIQAKNLESSKRWLNFLNQNLHLFKSPTQIWIKEEFRRFFKQLTLHLKHPELNIPHTNNDIENLFRQLNIRITSIGRFNRIAYANNYLKTWAAMRRFTAFSCCRKGRKYRNGKAPIELAGCDIKGLDYLNLD